MRKKIGLQISSIDSGLRTDIFNAIERNCKEKDIDLIVFPGGHGDPDGFQYLQATVYRHITRTNIDSLIVTSESYLNEMAAARDARPAEEDVPEEPRGDVELNEAEIDAVVGRHNSRQKVAEPIPTVCILGTDSGVPYITSEFKEKFRLLVAHIVVDHHCRSFNIVAGKQESASAASRLAACLDSLAYYGISVEKERIYTGALDEASGYAAMGYFFHRHLMPVDCVIALDDDMAIGIANYAKTHNLAIPDDFRLIAIDDIVRSQYNDVTLSTLSVHLGAICESAVSLAERLACGLQIPYRTTVPCSLRYRKSCGCVPIDDFETNYINERNEKVPFEESSVHEIDADYFVLEHDIFLMRRFFGNLNAALTLQNALAHLEESLPSLHIHSCAVVLYERKIVIEEDDEFELPSRATLMLLYDSLADETDEPEDGAKAPRRNLTFDPSRGLLPEGTFSDRRRLLVVKSLFYDNALFGYVVYEPGDLHQALYDTAFSMVAGILNTAILFTQKTAMEQHQRTMLQKLELANNELSGRSLTDELTGVYNRRGVMNFGQQSIDLAVEREQCGLVFYADMDGLKGINDTFGHDAGDIAIKTMADILKETFRNQDVVGRMGGDEFVIVAVGLDSTFLPRIRERITAAEARWYEENQPPFHLGISFGAVPFKQLGDSMDKLLAAADKLLYQEKVRKKSRSSVKEKLLTYQELPGSGKPAEAE